MDRRVGPDGIASDKREEEQNGAAGPVPEDGGNNLVDELFIRGRPVLPVVFDEDCDGVTAAEDPEDGGDED